MFDNAGDFKEGEPILDWNGLKVLHGVQQVNTVAKKRSWIFWELDGFLTLLEDESLVRQDNHVIDPGEEITFKIKTCFILFLNTI